MRLGTRCFQRHLSVSAGTMSALCLDQMAEALLSSSGLIDTHGERLSKKGAYHQGDTDDDPVVPQIADNQNKKWKWPP
jgi:hypothetical protein